MTNTTATDVDAVTFQAGTEAQTPLGRRLRELRSEITKSEVTPLGWDEIQEEVILRRGGWREHS